MAQGPDYKEGKNPSFILEPKRKINLNPDPWGKGEILDLGKPSNNLNELKFPIFPIQKINFEPNKPLEQVLAEREKRGLKLKPPIESIESSVTEYTEALKRYLRIEDTNDRRGEAVDPLLEPVL